jgi:hypothetical protein
MDCSVFETQTQDDTSEDTESLPHDLRVTVRVLAEYDE